jgi:hypothetical protein
MDEKSELVETTVGALVAESLEREANLMPPSYKEHADILRSQAQWHRTYQTKMIRIWGAAKK